MTIRNVWHVLELQENLFSVRMFKKAEKRNSVTFGANNIIKSGLGHELQFFEDHNGHYVFNCSTTRQLRNRSEAMTDDAVLVPTSLQNGQCNSSTMEEQTGKAMTVKARFSDGAKSTQSNDFERVKRVKSDSKDSKDDSKDESGDDFEGKDASVDNKEVLLQNSTEVSI